MLEGTLAELYERLWTLSEHENPRVRVMYRSPAAFSDGHAGAAAIFMLQQDGRDHPAIWVCRERPPSPQYSAHVAGASITELISLAHERGHERSWRMGSYQPMTMDEENRAWDHAEELLRGMGFDEWDAFKEHKAVSLGEHASRGTPNRGDLENDA
jgi:hypothetical protein